MASNSFDAFLELRNQNIHRGPTEDGAGAGAGAGAGYSPSALETLPPIQPVAPHFWGREESQLTELERLQCDRYRRDLDNYNLFLQQQELARANLLSLKEAEIAALERELRLQADLVKNTKQRSEEHTSE